MSSAITLSMETKNTETLSERLKRLRQEKGLSASEMANLIDVAQTTYREWEYGRGLKHLPPFLKISQVLAISVTELITGEKLAGIGASEELLKIEEAIREVRLKLTAMNK